MNAETNTNSADADADISADIVINSRTDIRDRLHHLPAGRRTPACTAGRISTPPEALRRPVLRPAWLVNADRRAELAATASASSC